MSLDSSMSLNMPSSLLVNAAPHSAERSNPTRAPTFRFDSSNPECSATEILDVFRWQRLYAEQQNPVKRARLLPQSLFSLAVDFRLSFYLPWLSCFYLAGLYCEFSLAVVNVLYQ